MKDKKQFNTLEDGTEIETDFLSQSISFPTILMRHIDRISRIVANFNDSDFTYLISVNMLDKMMQSHADKQYNADKKEITDWASGYEKKHIAGKSPSEADPKKKFMQREKAERLFGVLMDLLTRKGLTLEPETGEDVHPK